MELLTERRGREFILYSLQQSICFWCFAKQGLHIFIFNNLAIFFRVELKCRSMSCSNRQAVYGHLAAFLPCTKDTLMKRAKKLLIKVEEDKLLEPMKK